MKACLVIKTDVIAAQADTTLVESPRLLTRHPKRVPVLRNGSPVVTISRVDLIRTLARPKR